MAGETLSQLQWLQHKRGKWMSEEQHGGISVHGASTPTGQEGLSKAT